MQKTYAEYAALPADGRRWELIDGEFEVTPAPAPRHQTVSRHLQYELMRSLEESGLAQVLDAPIDVILSTFRCRAARSGHCANLAAAFGQ